MDDFSQLTEDYRRIEQAIRYIEAHARSQPELSEVAAYVGLSEYHFQRMFTRWAGISPKRFLQFLTKETAKELLAHHNVLEAAYAAGLSSPGRLHDLLVECEAVTPGEYRRSGHGMTIRYGFHPTPFGECLLAVTGRGICHLAFVDGDHSAALACLAKDWGNADLYEDPLRTTPIAAEIFSPSPGARLTLHLRGTNFQLKVWEALLKLPAGTVTSYQALAAQVHMPRAARAVGGAVASNPVAYLIPCHRVLQKAGGFGNYRYGPARKKAMLLWEQAGLGGD
jgi:AraC family transcriptional regulator of adaptative response/methylated-DNA-[protein]-cysteine methyltransferase